VIPQSFYLKKLENYKINMKNNTKTNIEWIEKKYNIKVSSFMKDVLDMLSITFYGLHHTEALSYWKGKDFCETSRAEYLDFRQDFATYDYNHLTTLVILAHIKGIRVAICHPNDAKRKACLRISFCKWKAMKHPTLEQSIKRVKQELQ
jgi:hypothetical protein